VNLALLNTGINIIFPLFSSLSCSIGYCYMPCGSGFGQQVVCYAHADECTELENVCPANTRCINTIGSYQCMAACRPKQTKKPGKRLKKLKRLRKLKKQTKLRRKLKKKLALTTMSPTTTRKLVKKLVCRTCTGI